GMCGSTMSTCSGASARWAACSGPAAFAASRSSTPIARGPPPTRTSRVLAPEAPPAAAPRADALDDDVLVTAGLVAAALDADVLVAAGVVAAAPLEVIRRSPF